MQSELYHENHIPHIKTKLSYLTKQEGIMQNSCLTDGLQTLNEHYAFIITIVMMYMTFIKIKLPLIYNLPSCFVCYDNNQISTYHKKFIFM